MLFGSKAENRSLECYPGRKTFPAALAEGAWSLKLILMVIHSLISSLKMFSFLSLLNREKKFCTRGFISKID